MISILSFAAITAGIVGTVSAESWAQTGGSCLEYSIAGSSLRRQGIVSNSTSQWWFSSFTSITKSSSMMGHEDLVNLKAIPPALIEKGDNHIGSLDYYDGKLYVPCEDGETYQAPAIAVYDADTLEYINYFSLPVEKHIDGVPWVCVDGPNNLAFSSIYDNVTEINVYALDRFVLLRTVPMSRMIRSIQGARMFEGSMYMVADATAPDTGYSVYKMNMESGDIQTVAGLPTGSREIESLAFTDYNGTIKMDILAIKDIPNPILNDLSIRIAHICTLERQ